MSTRILYAYINYSVSMSSLAVVEAAIQVKSMYVKTSSLKTG